MPLDGSVNSECLAGPTVAYGATAQPQFVEPGNERSAQHRPIGARRVTGCIFCPWALTILSAIICHVKNSDRSNLVSFAVRKNSWQQQHIILPDLGLATTHAAKPGSLNRCATVMINICYWQQCPTLLNANRSLHHVAKRKKRSYKRHINNVWQITYKVKGNKYSSSRYLLKALPMITKNLNHAGWPGVSNY